ncbi:hypothetical protein RCOM_0882640 [Ricinus communis]|uniref:Uncharacterized protein n=1 Tax=Ricinus communis TaxID=3988 RepID=B9SGC6_RICCO|nr:hypothetical protein RCOM_0882640 [Ricinus communis]|eukprot:XP_025014187.1 DUF724 domain-containing protein 5-like [Ricinus communis]
MAETFCCSSSDAQKSLSLCDKVNQLNDAGERELETITQSPVVNVQANSEPVENPETPFAKSSSIWEKIESLGVFHFMPQKLHFHPLVKCKEVCREGFAVGYMVSFASLVDKTSKLQIDDPSDVIHSYLDTLAELEMLGFGVKGHSESA